VDLGKDYLWRFKYMVDGQRLFDDEVWKEMDKQMKKQMPYSLDVKPL